MRETRRVDFHRVFDDFAHLGMTGEALAERIGLRASLLQRVASGRQHPAYLAADRICALWCHLTGKGPEFLPRTSDPEGAPRPEVPGIDRDDEQELSHAQLQSIVMVWAQISARSSGR